MPPNLSFRDASPSEDDELARILYNAFLPIWNHNWFQNLSSPLPPIPISSTPSSSSSSSSPLPPPQRRRLAFYRSWISLVRAHHGVVAVAVSHTPPSPSTSPNAPGSPDQIAAIALLLPPHARPSWLEPLLAWRTGLLPALLGYGITGMWRICGTFEGNVHRLIAAGLKELGVAEGKEERLLFCQGCVRNPEWRGEKGPARGVLDWGVRRFWEGERERDGKGKLSPVWLDTTTDEGVRAYEEIGFRVVGECGVETGADERGFALGKGAGEEERERGRKVARQRVMVRMPEG